MSADDQQVQLKLRPHLIESLPRPAPPSPLFLASIRQRRDTEAEERKALMASGRSVCSCLPGTTSAAANTSRPAGAELRQRRRRLPPPPRAPANAEAPLAALPVTPRISPQAGIYWSRYESWSKTPAIMGLNHQLLLTTVFLLRPCSRTLSPAARRTCPATAKRRMILPRCPQALRSPAPNPGKALLLTARLLVTQ